MSLPTLSKTWQYDVNRAIPAQGSTLATAQKLMRQIKTTLTSFGTLPWTVQSSSDSSTSGASDKWTADANLVWAAGSRSWIVLRQTGMATNFELCIDLSNASSYTATIVVSPSAGFTGGSVSARPTATDEIVVVNNTWWGSFTTNVSYVLNVWQSTDGKSTRVLINQGGVAGISYWHFEVPKNPPSGWTNPSASLVLCNGGSGMLTYANVSGSALWKSRYAAANYSLFGTGEAQNGTSSLLANGILTVANEVDSNYPMFPIGLACTTVGMRGRHGTLNDVWWAPSVLNSADTLPNDASNQFAVFGNIILPWNGGAAPVLT